MKKVLKDNRLLFDRPHSYWTIGVFVTTAILFTLVSVGKPVPWWLGLTWPLVTLPWVFFFMKGGGWDWVQQRIPKQMKAPDTIPDTPKKPAKKKKPPEQGTFY